MVRIFPVWIALSGLSFVVAGTKWTPENFDWDSLTCNDTIPSGLWMNRHEAPPTTDLSLLPDHHPTNINSVGISQVAVLAVLGWAWRGASLAAATIGLKNSVHSCKQTANGDAGWGPCIEGLFTTVVGFGGVASAERKLLHRGGRLIMPNRFLADGTVDLEMNTLTRRDVDAQNNHDDFVYIQLRSLSSRDPEFLGYAKSDHRLAKKDFGNHPLVPMFRFDHFKHGSMEMTTRDTMNGTFITAAYTGHPTHLLGRHQIEDLKTNMKRQEVYDKEALNTGVLEARFDADASRSDPASISADAKTLFNTFEPEVSCFMGGNVKDHSVLDVQMYDKTNKATFGFGTIGVFNNDDDAHSIEEMEPAGMPLSQCK
ncbi:hypothetical protein N7508_003202 [Penicillium antarcticum]|uniref:uncharacterized protein n=1 Tax=Penicillium antarcticum TaxID=416450 RepID=UPI00239855D3|nr:uncharacterized protein N7508_003202 [Penicillium antarcticum]KAJ5312372.1 hypothetical protein N7508_003202 [Penicillium antarcticum]